MNLGEIFAFSVHRLTEVGIEAPRLDARLLIAEVIGKNPSFILMHEDFLPSKEECEKINSFISRRAGHEPVSRIIGRRDFWKLSFAINEETLDPRPDSETLIETVIRAFSSSDRALRILDLGTGSGCLLLALLSELKNATGTGIDISPKAIAAATENAAGNNLSSRSTFITGGWNDLNGLNLRNFDIIISNPPYIPSADISGLAPEVKNFDPSAALDGGEDGLNAYREIAAVLPFILAESGHFFCEIGQGQEKDVCRIFTAFGLQHIETNKDFAGIVRCLHFGR